MREIFHVKEIKLKLKMYPNSRSSLELIVGFVPIMKTYAVNTEYSIRSKNGN